MAQGRESGEEGREGEGRGEKGNGKDELTFSTYPRPDHLHALSHLILTIL